MIYNQISISKHSHCNHFMSLKQKLKQFPPVITKTEASYQRHVLQLLSDLVKQQKQANRLLQIIAHESIDADHRNGQKYNAFQEKSILHSKMPSSMRQLQPSDHFQQSLGRHLKIMPVNLKVRKSSLDRKIQNDSLVNSLPSNQFVDKQQEIGHISQKLTTERKVQRNILKNLKKSYDQKAQQNQIIGKIENGMDKLQKPSNFTHPNAQINVKGQLTNQQIIIIQKKNQIQTIQQPPTKQQKQQQLQANPFAALFSSSKKPQIQVQNQKTNEKQQQMQKPYENKNDEISVEQPKKFSLFGIPIKKNEQLQVQKFQKRQRKVSQAISNKSKRLQMLQNIQPQNQNSNDILGKVFHSPTGKRINLIGQTLKTALQMKQQDQKHYARLTDLHTHSDKRQTKLRIHFIELLKQNYPLFSEQEAIEKSCFQRTVSEWIGIVYRATASICWNMLQSQFLSFDETKVLFTENIMFNYIEFMKDIRETHQIQHIGIKNLQKTVTDMFSKDSVAVLQFLCKQYPQTKINAPNMALRELIPMINEKGRIQYDLIGRSGIKFRHKDNKNYAPQIMTFINYIIDVTDKEYDQFQKKMWKVFESLFIPIQLRKQKEQELFSSKLYGEQAVSYRQKVKKFTRYSIHRKIPKNTPKYTQQQINNGIFFIKSPKIMRVIAKWVQDLICMIRDPKNFIRDWFYPFKNHEGQEYHATYPIRNAIYNKVLQRRQQIFHKLEQIQQECYSVCGELTKKTHIFSQGLLHLSEQQINVGLFASNLKNALSSYLFMQLNEVIHFLLQIPLKIDDKVTDVTGFFFEKKAKQDLNNINLISFRIFDLIRCRCVSGQDEIIYLINLFKNKGQKSEVANFQLVRVKDRLTQGSRDILINSKINQNLVSEIQLSITSNVQQKQDLLDKYNHFLYELRRSTLLGPLIQNVSIWTSLQQRASYFQSLCNKRFKQPACQNFTHKCASPMIFKFQGPLVCSACYTFFHIPRSCLMNWQCLGCQSYICGQCRFSGMSALQRKRQIFGSTIDSEFLKALTEFNFGKQYEKTLKELPVMCFFVKKRFLKIQLSTLRNYEPYENNSRQLVQIVVKKQIRKIITRGFLSQENNIQKDQLKDMIIFGIDNSYIEVLTVDQIRKMFEENQKIKVINFMNEPTYLDSLTQISSNVKKELLLNDIQVLMYEKDLEKITVMKLKKTNTLLLLQIYVDDQQMRKKLTRRNNLQTLKQLARSNSSIICLQHKNISTQLDMQWIQTRIGWPLFYNLCKNVKKLYLNYGRISNIQSLVYMTQVEILSISNNIISSLKGVEGMTKLKSVQFDYNLITTMQPLKNLSELQIIIGSHNRLTTLQGIQKLYKLKEISLYANQIDDFGKYLNNLKKLEMIYFRKNAITKYQHIKQLPGLKKLSLSENPLLKAYSVSFAANLKNLSITGVNLKAIPFQQIESVNLIQLSLHQNEITEISGLQKQTNLKILGLNSNAITKISGLDHLKLQRLCLSFNKIRVIEGILNFMDTLQQITIEGNQICDIGDLRKREFEFKVIWSPQQFSPQARSAMNEVIGSVLIGSVASKMIEGLMAF